MKFLLRAGYTDCVDAFSTTIETSSFKLIAYIVARFLGDSLSLPNGTVAIVLADSPLDGEVSGKNPA